MQSIDQIQKQLVGRFVVSPMSCPTTDGRYTASVSIRSGRGAASTDRIMRFVPVFPDRVAALRYAAHEGVSWAHRH